MVGAATTVSLLTVSLFPRLPVRSFDAGAPSSMATAANRQTTDRLRRRRMALDEHEQDALIRRTANDKTDILAVHDLVSDTMFTTSRNPAYICTRPEVHCQSQSCLP